MLLLLIYASILQSWKCIELRVGRTGNQPELTELRPTAISWHGYDYILNGAHRHVDVYFIILCP